MYLCATDRRQNKQEMEWIISFMQILVTVSKKA